MVRELVARGAAVRALARKPEQLAALAQPGVEPAQGDIRDLDALRRAMTGVQGVFHIAALFRQADQPDAVYYDVNVTGVRNVMDVAIAAGVPRVIHCSTVGVLGHIEHPPANERTPFNPGDIYQRSKMEGEKVALEYFRSGRIGGVVIRPAMIYGPGDTRLRKMFRLIARRRFFYVGRGQNLVHFIDVRDLARAFRLAMEHTELNAEVFIIAGARALPLRDVCDLIARELGVPSPRLKLPVRPIQWLGTLCERICLPLKINPPLYRRRVDFYTKDRCFDTRKAREKLGFLPERTLEEEVHDILHDYRERGWL